MSDEIDETAPLPDIGAAQPAESEAAKAEVKQLLFGSPTPAPAPAASASWLNRLRRRPDDDASKPGEPRSRRAGRTRQAPQDRITLRFSDPDIEADYQRKLRPRASEQLRASLTSSLFLWPLAGAAFYTFVPEGRTVFFVVPAMWIFLGILLVLRRRAQTLGGLYRIGAVSNTIPGLTVLGVLWVDGLFGPAAAMTTVLLLAFAFNLLNLPFIHALIAATPYFAASVALLQFSPDASVPFFQAFVMTVILGILASSAYAREGAARRDFFLTRVIADQDRELEAERARQLGQYTLESVLGRGGMGVVYRARHALLRRPTAVKILSAEDAGKEALARFEREVQLTSELSHPNIVAIYDYGHSPVGEFYYAMEHLPGLDLESLVGDHGPLPPARAVPILAQVCDGLHEAHQRGVVHRDIKPGNIIVSRLGTRCDVAKVVDFGLVKELDETEVEHALAGTPAYLSPEAIDDPSRAGRPSDIYALGAVAYFILTGERVFPARTIAAMLMSHTHKEPNAPSAVAPSSIPSALDELVLRCLSKRPLLRPSASELATELRALDLEADPSELEAWWDEFERSRDLTPSVTGNLELTLTVDIRGR